MRSTRCKRCKGHGWRNIPCGMGPYGEQAYYYGPCDCCGGSGKQVMPDPDFVPGEFPRLPHDPSGH